MNLRAAAKTAELAFVLEDVAGLVTDSAAKALHMAAIVRSVATFCPTQYGSA